MTIAIIPLLPALLFGGIGTALAIGCILFVLHERISIPKMRSEIKNEERLKDAFKAMIKSKDVRTVKVGIYDRCNNEIGECEFQSDRGMDSNVQVGKAIYIY